MTLIIGIKCSDGIAIGADSAATLGTTTGLRTVIQPMAKLAIVRGQAIVGVSGPVGTAQLFEDRVDSTYNDLRNRSAVEAGRRLRQAFLNDQEITLKVASLAQSVVGPSAQNDALCHTLVAAAPGKPPYLIQFDYQCALEVATDDLPFVAIGSGQSIADPFLAFLRHLFWQDSLPSLNEGNFAAVWTLQLAIRAAPGGIAAPVSIANLRVSSGQPSARLLPESEIKEHYEAVDAAEDRLREFRSEQRPGLSEPKPPAAPAG